MGEVLVHALIEVHILDEEIVSICSQKFARQEFLEHLALELLNDIFSVGCQNLLRTLLRERIKILCFLLFLDVICLNHTTLSGFLLLVGNEATDVL